MWIDPGKTNGFAEFHKGTNWFQAGQENFTELGDRIQSYAELDPSCISVGYESFIITPATGKLPSTSWSLKVIGMIEWLCYRHGITLLPPATPVMRMLGMNKLKERGWWTPGKVHANDAAAHLLSYLYRTGQTS
jgi:hypothetical protein